MPVVKSNTPDLTVYGAQWCGDCRRSKRLLDDRNVSYRWVDLESEPDATAAVLERNDGRRIIPTIVFPDGTHLAEPSDDELSSKLSAHGLL